MKFQHWSAGWNQGAYLPNPDAVAHGLTLAEARDHLIADLENELDAWAEANPEDDEEDEDWSGSV